MILYLRNVAILLCCISLLVSLAAAPAIAGDDLSVERGKFKAMLKNVANDVEKNFYDPSLKGLDWKALTEEAKVKIDNAKSVGDMMAAIYVLTDKLHDSHTKFMPPSRAMRLFFGFEAKAIGEEIRIYEIRKGDPAERAGLRLGDRIISVNGYRADRPSFDIMMMDFRALRPRTVFDLMVQTGNEPPRAVHLEARKKVEARVLDSEHLADIWDLINESQNWSDEHRFKYARFADDNVGYAYIRDFPYDGDTFLRNIMDILKGSKAIIIDLRSNPGGELECLKAFMGVFESQDTTVLNMVSRKKTEPMMVHPKKPSFAGVPFYILVDSETGSSAEIFARHFQKTGKATVIGDKTSGRVTVSRFFQNELGGYTAVPYGAQIGIARAVFSDGEELEGRGVTPDIACLPTGDEMRKDQDPCLSRAVVLAKEKLGIKSKDEDIRKPADAIINE